MTASGSPPTRRVVAVIETLVESERALTVSDIVERLSIARATVTAVLNELTAADWVVRDANLAYRPGVALARLSPAEPVQLGTAVARELAALSEAAGCGATLSRITQDRLTMVAKHYAGAAIIPGLSVGQSLPVTYPAGAAVLAWRPPSERERWSRSAGAADSQVLLDFVTVHGFAMFRPEADDAALVDVLAELLGALGAELLRSALRVKLLRQLGRLTSRAYTEADIDAAQALPVSYISAPVFRGADVAYEVQLGPLRAEVGPGDRARYIEAIRAGARAISHALDAAGT